MADFRLGRLKFNWRGNWAPSTDYVIDDIVKFGANTYVCTTNHTSVSDETNWYATDLAKWSLHTEGLSSRGTWAPGIFYKPNDIISYGNTVYRVVTAFTSTSTFSSANLTEYVRGFEYEDSWNSTVEYQQGDVVTYGGYSYVATTINTNKPPAFNLSTDWDVITTGFDVVGTYSSTTDYKPGDVVQFGGYSYVAITTSTGLIPTETSGWDLIVKGINWVGSFSTTTEYKLGDAVSRNSNSYISIASSNLNNDPATDTFGTYWNPLTQGSETNVLTTDGDLLFQSGAGPARLPIGTEGKVLTVDNGYPSWQTNNVTDPVYYVTQEGSDTNDGSNISNAFASIAHAVGIATGQSTIYVKAGTYDEVLPMVVPAGVSIVGDNIRTTKITPASGSSNYWELSLDNGLVNVPFGAELIFSNGARGTYINANGHETVAHILRNTAYATFLTTTTLTSVNGVAYSGPTTTISSLIVRDNDESAMFLLSNRTMLKDLVMEGLTGFVAPGVAFQASGSITGTILTSVNLVNDLVGTTITGTGVVPATKVVNVIDETTAEVSISQTVASTTLTFTAPPQDINNATVKGVYVSLNPNSPITKSPYVSQCSAFSVGGVGAVVDGRIHRQYPPGSATPSNKSIVFDSYTNIHDNGVSFWVTNNAAAEFVSCFSYYAYIAFAATRGGRIRSLAGNSSWGTYGLVSSGYNFNETPIVGSVEGLQLEFDAGSLIGEFSSGHRVIGQTSGAHGLLNSVQTDKLIYSLVSSGPLGVGTGFAPGETIVSPDTGSSATLRNNTSANAGLNGFTIASVGITSTLQAGGSVEFVTGSGNGGINNQVVTGADPFTYVISNVSYQGPDGRGTLTVQRGALGTVAAGHTGATTYITTYPESGQTTTTLSAIGLSDTTIFIANTNGFVQNGFAKIGDELLKISNIASTTQLDVIRGSDGTTAASSSSGAAVVAIGASLSAGGELLRDIDGATTAVRVFNTAGFNSNQYIKIDSEIMDITNVSTDTLGLSLIVLAEEKAANSYDGQEFKVRYLYSQGRFTGHDFLQVGTGGTVTTNWPGLPTQDPVPTQEVVEDFPGRVFYVSADSQGNFRVGRYFKVNQATGSATLNASAFDLSGLTSLRLGSIGAQLGAQINEFSTDPTLSQNSNEKVPTQAAVKAYIDNGLRSNITSAKQFAHFVAQS